VLGIVVGRRTGVIGDPVSAAEPEGGDEAGSTPGSNAEGGSNAAGIVPAADHAASRGETGDRNEVEPSRSRAGGSGAEGSRTPPTSTTALQDPANVYTVLVVTYGDTQIDLARATQQLLGDMGLPVFPPVRNGNHLEILVGASPTTAGLQEIQRRVREATDWNGVRGAFRDAYAVRIEDHVRR
jgi:hypothetical protein